VDLLRFNGIRNEAVLKAVAKVPRHLFVPEHLRAYAYSDDALPIAEGQTISQPYVVARMSELLLGRKQKLNKVLEIGTGSGYQAAILSRLANKVYSVERIQSLLVEAEQALKAAGVDNVTTLFADGYGGWGQHAPYDGIIVTAAAPEAPEALLQQLAENGRLVIPVNSGYGGQDLRLIIRKGEDFVVEYLDPVMFVPMKHGVVD